MSFVVRDCKRCGTVSVQMKVKGWTSWDRLNFEVFVVCNSCGRGSMYAGQPEEGKFQHDLDIAAGRAFANSPIQIHPEIPALSSHIPDRTTDLFRQAATCRRYDLNEAAGSMFRKTIDVGTKELFVLDPRLSGKSPATALRSRLAALGEMRVLEPDIVELADIAALDGNDATHDEDPYSASEAEMLEELTMDLLDRMFVRPAKILSVRQKQIEAGLRKPDVDD